MVFRFVRRQEPITNVLLPSQIIKLFIGIFMKNIDDIRL